MGSTIISQRLHVGLQQLTALAAVTHSFLGPNKNHKFIQDESTGESSLVCTCFRVLEHLDLTCSVGQLANETIQAHQKVFHSGAGCLLFMAGVWSRAALECLHRDISIPHIVSAMSEGLDICCKVCRSNSVSIEDVRPNASDSGTSVLQGSPHTVLRNPVTGMNPSHGALNNKKQSRIKLTHSRHFCANDEADKNTTPGLFSHAVSSKGVDIAHLAEAVSHGCVDAMSLVVEVSKMQSKNNGSGDSCRTFDVNKLVTCTLPGLSEDHSCVLPGCVILLSAEQASLVHHMKEQKWQVVLINGDLSEKYRHLGFNSKNDISQVTDKLDLKGLSKEDDWEDNVLTTLLKNNVNLVLVNGEASERLTQHCMSHRILVVERMKPDILKDFAETTGAVPVTYATQLSKHCVGTGVEISIWRDCSGNRRRASMAVNIVADRTALVTVVLTTSVHSKLQTLEDCFWGCAYRLHHTLKDRKLLPGAGKTELLCVQILQKHIKDNGEQTRGKDGTSAPQAKQGRAGNPHRADVFQLMADGWMDYISTLMLNSGTCSKVDAWTTINQQLIDLNGGLSLDANFSRLLLRDDTEDGMMSPDMKRSAGKVYDNMTVKLEAWRKALDLVFLVLQTDTEIITGIDPKQVEGQSNVMVL
ncbi:Bardet-Biedl syndrome 12 protein [Oncorhynchus tshawytscha]|uniref:Bardet-Biedl syndrome 12 n=1 Tax=Oncorhynchus tshawytscha TaxID=74940 RepID=A0A8C8HDK7_ONCTS|nr:Bardet-Biedl syndrome 12 protein [Oncorhynchus tshawytscha]XP_024268164.1 Bardet-Biedl syndrome 12 protein [Oncorhynchus tshawytscha]